MTEGINFSGFSCITAAAVTGFYSLFGAGRRSGYCPLTEAVTEGIHIAVHMTFTASAGMGGIALFGASGRNNRIRVFMHQVGCDDAVNGETVGTVTAIGDKANHQRVSVDMYGLICKLFSCVRYSVDIDIVNVRFYFSFV